MDHRLPVLGLMLASGLLLAAQGKVTSAKATPKGAAERPKQSVAPKTKPLELNLASKAELMKLPGINESLAAKIIAGRPYLTKTNLVTRNILPVSLYKPIRHLVSARQAPAVK